MGLNLKCCRRRIIANFRRVRVYVGFGLGMQAANQGVDSPSSPVKSLGMVVPRLALSDVEELVPLPRFGLLLQCAIPSRPRTRPSNANLPPHLLRIRPRINCLLSGDVQDFVVGAITTCRQ